MTDANDSEVDAKVKKVIESWKDNKKTFRLKRKELWLPVDGGIEFCAGDSTLGSSQEDKSSVK